MNQPIHPCINCIYFKACGETTRTMPCDGRMTKSEKKNEHLTALSIAIDSLREDKR